MLRHASSDQKWIRQKFPIAQSHLFAFRDFAENNQNINEINEIVQHSSAVYEYVAEMR